MRTRRSSAGWTACSCRCAKTSCCRANGPLGRQVSLLPAGGYRALAEADRRRWLESTIRALSPATGAAGRRTAARRPHREAFRRSPIGGRAVLARRPGSAWTRRRRTCPASARPAPRRLEKLGVRTAGDAALLFPRRFNDFTDMRSIAELRPEPGQQTVVAHGVLVARDALRPPRERDGGRPPGPERARCGSSGSTCRISPASWRKGRRSWSRARCARSGAACRWRTPSSSRSTPSCPRPGKLVPVYPATQGLSQRTLRRAVGAAVEALDGPRARPDPRLAARARAHEPARRGDPHAALPGFVHRRRGRAAAAGPRRVPRDPGGRAHAPGRVAAGRAGTAALARRPPARSCRRSLPFPLTGAQQRTARRDPQRHPGRTADAATAPGRRRQRQDRGRLRGGAGGGALRLPGGRHGARPEILAEQHYRSLARLLGGEELSALDGMFAPDVARASRAAAAGDRLAHGGAEAQVRSDAAHGGADIVIGTHALLEDAVELPRLALAVVDEQHRFGVPSARRCGGRD